MSFPANSVRPIREEPLVRRTPNGQLSDVAATPYTIPDQMCATRGRSSKSAMHCDCRRDAAGRLLVVER